MSAGDRPRWRSWYARVEQFYAELFATPWRAGLQREADRQGDLLVAMLFLEALGIENPASYHTLELYPELVESFHDWHRRAGMERFGDAAVCC